ncbi:MAG: hypothetical protein HDQ98_14880 [Lachnospiraceae bacterium]|nr:hypothetical protein [Lachnospiraceae bacterium]
MLYHVSQKKGLKTLQPHVSTHKKAYVYAIENMVTGMLFGIKKDDFDFIISIEDEGTPVVWECYPEAFQKNYQGKSCSVYQVDEKGFLRGMTSWSPELVCESEVEVLEEIVIDDLYQRLLEEEQKGNLKIHRYEFCEEYRRKIAAHIVDRLIRFGIDLNTCMERDERFSTYYKGIIQALLSAEDGHLLQ